ncbi:FtsX-like permease family protein [Dyadobacter psychrotolerans]|uniref:FtsX-like permease family protein n=2 Tax=Dyadobacter psychrotolerans TaxID=2541721 RepID=A0A4R5E0H5_9BACT|nr:FtsX-like permease family protein [Dyadobacter psychrotolerans]
MLKNYLKIAWRNLMKRRFFAFVTILGLSVGLTFTFLIAGFICGEIQVNLNLRNAENQYIIRSKWKNPDMGIDFASLGPLGKTLKENYPDLVANYYRFDGITVAVSKNEKHFREEIQTGDSTLLSMYGFPLLHGDPNTALNKPNSIVLTDEKAIKYFGKTDVLGQTLTLHNFVGGKQEFQVTGVLEKLPDNSISHLQVSQIEMFIPLSSLDGRKGAEDSWAFPYMVTFIELKKGVLVKDLEKPVNQILNTNVPEDLRANLQVYFTPLKQYYWEANNGLVRKMVYTLSAVTVFILFMAIVNFINISIGNSSSRLKEIGVRKVLGSFKGQLLRQFLAESILLAFFATLVSVLFYEVFRSYFAGILGKEIASSFSLLPFSILIIVVIALLTGLAGGFYPAFVLSSLPSVDSMKGKLKLVKENIRLRRLLMVSQFSIALFVITAAVIVSQQVKFFFNKDLGYKKESLMSVAVPRDWTPEGVAKMAAIRDQFSHLKEVNQVSLSYEIPNGNNGNQFGIYKPGQDSANAIYTQFLGTDEKYADTYQIKMAAGKFFHAKEGVYQPGTIVLNETAVKSLGFQNAEDAVGQLVNVHSFSTPFIICGVSKNFHFESMHQSMKPLAFLHINGGNAYRFLTFRIVPSHLGESVAAVEKKWRELMPDAPFEYAFMDDTLQKLYKSEVQLQKASQVATLLAIVIVLLGVLGMVAQSTARRTKELGIRKVLGATAWSIIILFVKEFLLVMGISVLISFPLAMLGMKKWLENYAYRINLNLLTFAWIGMIFGIVIVGVVCLQTYKAASMNPVKSITSE